MLAEPMVEVAGTPFAVLLRPQVTLRILPADPEQYNTVSNSSSGIHHSQHEKKYNTTSMA